MNESEPLMKRRNEKLMLSKLVCEYGARIESRGWSGAVVAATGGMIAIQALEEHGNLSF